MPPKKRICKRKALSVKHAVNLQEDLIAQHSGNSLQASPVQETAGRGVKLIAIMKEAYGPLPAAFWCLSRQTDQLASRGLFYDNSLSRSNLLRMTIFPRFPVISVRTADDYNGPTPIASTAKSVVLGNHFDQKVKFPVGVERIQFGDSFDFVQHGPLKTLLPSSLIEVTFGLSFDVELCDLPPGLRKLTLGDKFDRPIRLPPQLVEVNFGALFNQPNLQLPSSVERVTFGAQFDQPITLPKNIRVACFGRSFSQTVLLPAGIREVTFGAAFSKAVYLPSGLEHASFHRNYHLPITVPPGCQLTRSYY